MPNTTREKNAFLQDLDQRLEDIASKLETRIASAFSRQVIPKLTVNESGAIIDNDENRIIINQFFLGVSEQLGQFSSNQLAPRVARSLLRVRGLNDQYFSDFGGEIWRDSMNTIFSDAVGLDPDGNPIPGGFVSRSADLQGAVDEMRGAANQAVAAGTTPDKFTKTMGNAILGTPNKSGSVTRTLRENVGDGANNADRLYSDRYAKRLKMDAFIYAGGRIRTSRCFCIARNGKIFTRQEAQEWATLTPRDGGGSSPCSPGKRSHGPAWKGGYNPIRDMGGFNCRHSPQWITNRTAARRRPDLELGEDGSLVPANA